MEFFSAPSQVFKPIHSITDLVIRKISWQKKSLETFNMLTRSLYFTIVTDPTMVGLPLRRLMR